MMNRMFAGVLSAMTTMLPGVALASGVDSINISRPTLDVCDGAGTTISFEVDVTHSSLNDRVAVWIDDELVFGPEDDDSATIVVGPVLTGDGEHTIVARSYDSLLGDLEDEDIVAEDTYTFDIDCYRGGDLRLLDDVNRHIYRSDAPNEGGTDCCPGGDSSGGGGESEQSTPVVKTTGKVKGALTTHIVNLAPLNGLFRSVFGRTPNFSEWTYWANRMLTDKPQADAILGAMQWHHMHGLTTGK